MIDFNLTPSQPQTSGITLQDAAQGACEQIGVIYQNRPVDGGFHALDVADKSPRNGAGRIRLYADGAGGQAWNHVTGETAQFWAKSDQTLTPAEAAERRQRAKAERERAEALLAEERAAAAELAAKVWGIARPTASSVYFDRKQVEPTGTIKQIGLDELAKVIGYHPAAKGKPFANGMVQVVPVSDGAEITSIEMIDTTGLKAGLKNGRKKSCFWSSHQLPAGDGTGLVIGVGEGVSTMLTYYIASGNIGIAALSCGNLKTVALYFRNRYPAARIEIVSDVGNGEQSAIEAARAVDGWLIRPNLVAGSTGSDINDQYTESGLQSVKDSIAAARQIKTTPDAGTVTPDAVTSAAPQVEPKSAPFSMADLVEKKFKPIQWAIPGLLAEGLAILSGPPKIGKSWMVMDFCIAVVSGGFALGHFQAIQGGALLGSLEDNERRLQSRLKKRLKHSGGANLDQFHAITTWKRLDQGGLNDLDEWLKDHPACRLVVIDTIQKIKAKPSSKNGNAYENDYESYGALQRLALQRQCCILLIHHNRKSDSKNDGDPLEAISGSTGITGTMDTILMLRRPRGTAGAVLTVTGRDIQDAEYGLSFDQALCGWTVAGKAAEVGLQEGSNTSLIVEVLKERSGQMLTAQEIFDALEGSIKLAVIKTESYRLSKKGLIRNMHGKFGYALPSVTMLPVLPVLPQINSINSINIVEGVTRNLYDGESSTSNTISTSNAINTSNAEAIPIFTEADFEGALL